MNNQSTKLCKFCELKQYPECYFGEKLKKIHSNNEKKCPTCIGSHTNNTAIHCSYLEIIQNHNETKCNDHYYNKNSEIYYDCTLKFATLLYLLTEDVELEQQGRIRKHEYCELIAPCTLECPNALSQ
jgi:hypothetical protein